MAEFNDNNQDGPGGDDGADALTGALAASDGGGFVVEQKKKSVGAGTIAMGGVLLACGAAMAFMGMRSGPSAADAATPESAGANKTISQFLSDDKDNVKKMRDLLTSTEKAVQQFVTYPGKTQVPVKNLRGNPFRLRAAKPVTAKADDDAATARKRLEDRRLAAQAGVRKLNLQSIVHGKTKACMVNNTLYTEGQKVEGFTVEKIEPQRVVVRSDVFRFELKMKR
jgi:hypothetical protein